jgi:hypothetical protein
MKSRESQPMTESAAATSNAYNKSCRATDALIKSVQSVVDHYSTDADDDAKDNPVKTLTEATPLLLQLKQSQRLLGLTLGSDLASQLNSRKRQVENDALHLQNILYEKEHLLNEIRSCKQLECPHLLQMAKDELDTHANADADAHITSQTKETDANQDGEDVDTDETDAIIDKFLAPNNKSNALSNAIVSYRDTARHSYNLSKLHSELSTRANLHKQLLNAKKEKSLLLQTMRQKRKFLTSIPQQFYALEKSMNQLKNHFKNDDMNGSAEWIVTANVQERNDAVLELCAPLYTLYVQFVSFIRANQDRFQCHLWTVKVVDVDPFMDLTMEDDMVSNASHDNAGEALMECTCKESKAVQLQIPNGNGKDHVKINFEFLSKLQIILAHVSPNAAFLQWGMVPGEILLLQDLFPQDDGRDLPPGCGANMIYQVAAEVENGNGNKNSGCKEASSSINDVGGSHMEEEEWEETEEQDQDASISSAQMAIWKIRQGFQTTTKHGRPYHWCQYLAGLNYPTHNSGSSKDELLVQSQIEATTKTVLLALYRRIRAHATLVILVKKLSQAPNPIPTHSSIDISSDGSVSTNLVSFSRVDGSMDDSGIFNVILKRSAKSLKAQVKIHARYPAVPPEWSLQETMAFSEPDAKRGREGVALKVGGDELPLYDSSLGRIESRINALEGHDLYFNDSDEVSYDWILMHQMKRLIVEWDTLQNSIESKGEKVGVGSDCAGERRGRDRCPSALYELYKRGL